MAQPLTGPYGSPIRDDFNRAGTTSPPSAQWTTGFSGSNTALALAGDTDTVKGGTASSFNDGYRNDISPGPDVEVWCIASVLATGTEELFALYARGVVNTTAYEISISANALTSVSVARENTVASFPGLGTVTLSASFAVNDGLALVVRNNVTPVLEVWWWDDSSGLNKWQLMGTITDNFSITAPTSKLPFLNAGRVALELQNTTSRITLFGAGTIQFVAPIYNPVIFTLRKNRLVGPAIYGIPMQDTEPPAIAGPIVIQAVVGDSTFSAISTAVVAPQVPVADSTFSSISSLAIAPQATPANVNFSAVANIPIIVQAVPANATFSAGTSDTAAIAPQAVPANTNFSAGTNSIAIAPQAVPANTTFSCLTKAAIAPQAIPANANFSASDSLTIAPQSIAALTTFAASVGGLAENVNPPSATITYSNPSTASIAPQSVPANVNFSTGTESVALAPQSPAALTTFNTGAIKAAIQPQVPSAARVTFDGIATIPGSAVFVTTPGSTVTYSIVVPVLAENLQAVPANFAANTGTIKVNEIAVSTPASATFSSSSTVGESVGSVPGSVTYSVGVTKLTEQLQSNSGTAIFSASGSIPINLVSTPGNVTFSNLGTVGFAVSSISALATFTIGNIVVHYDISSIPGYARITIAPNAQATLSFVGNKQAEITILENAQATLTFIESARAEISVFAATRAIMTIEVI